MKKYLAVSIALIFIVVGCATLMANRGKIVGTANLAHSAVLILAPLALSAEKITQAEYDEIVIKANKFKELVDMADKALEAYETVQNAENKDRVDTAIIEVMKLLPEIQKLIELLE